MYYKGTTQVPNEIFDQYLLYLNQSQIKVLLVVIRQTLGWIDPKTKQRKRKDWISVGFFVRRTGLTRKSITYAIQELIEKELIIALDFYDNELRLPKNRKGKRRIYYAYAPYFRAIKTKSWVDILTNLFTYRPYTKPTHTKNNNGKIHNSVSKQTDYERYLEIQASKESIQNKPP